MKERIGNPNQGDAPIRESEVLSSIGDLERNISRAESLLSSLKDRIDGVLAPPIPLSDTAVTGNHSCYVAQCINNQAERVDYLCSSLQDALARLRI